MGRVGSRDPRGTDIAVLLAEIEADPASIFWG